VAYKIRLAPPAIRALERTLPEQVAAAAWEFINGALAENPQRVGKPLTGELAGLWSARRGEYRIVYSIEKRIVTVTIVRISHRANAYR
jgi:mRNA-degrading endonuclease RelE of RelBE toxin-antitoxin system